MRLYRESVVTEACIAQAGVLHGQQMSYNNYVDSDAALDLCCEVSDVPAAVVVRRNTPCGCATGPMLEHAFKAAGAGDPLTGMGTVVAVIAPVDANTATLMQSCFIQVLIAPDYSQDAMRILTHDNRGIRLLKLTQPLAHAWDQVLLRQISGGLPLQTRNTKLYESWASPTEHVFPDKKKELAVFGLRVCKHIKSDAIVIVQCIRRYRTGRGSVQPW